MLSSCPFCHEKFLSSELEWHANSHFVEEELERDMLLATQIAFSPRSPRSMKVTADYVGLSPTTHGRISKASTSRSNDSSNGDADTTDMKMSCLIALQSESLLHKVDGGLMSLLRRCLELETGNLVSIITSHVDHYQSLKSEDSGWGCGWRNIQILSSHLLVQREDARNLLFGGSGYVPDIPSLQRWLEIAWEKGFDTAGAEAFKGSIYGSRKWIGATECATLFRSFGLRAKVVDFDSLRDRGKNEEHVCGPMDKYVRKFDQRVSADAFVCMKLGETNYNGKNKSSGHQVLMDWVWHYFAGSSKNTQRVRVSEKTPLYFQHDGHSRTIVGIQLQKENNGLEDQYILLVLDPSENTAALEGCLRGNNGWKKRVKRGVDTLKKPQYQLCYIDQGIASGEEIQKLKTIDSILVEF